MLLGRFLALASYTIRSIGQSPRPHLLYVCLDLYVPFPPFIVTKSGSNFLVITYKVGGS